MSGRYAALPNPRSMPDVEREMDDAFESDNEELESKPLTTALSIAIPGAYDFERDYDFPPPGSPPGASAAALPNNHGNSNGVMPSSPVRISGPRLSFFRRAVGALLPTHYTRVPSEPARRVGGGIENDGVFANVMAKPTTTAQLQVQGEDGNIYLVAEDAQKEAPPSYAAAQQDSAPPYWETTVHAPAPADGSDMIIDDMVTGSVFVFLANLFTSFFFQFVGFLLTYLLHTTHAAKFGSRAGLGITLIQYGFYSRAINSGNATAEIVYDYDGRPLEDPTVPANGSLPTPAMGNATMPDDTITYGAGVITSKEWISFILMTLGWFLLMSSVVGFWRVKRWESSIRSSSVPLTQDELERDRTVRRNLEIVFGLSYEPEDDENDLRREELLRNSVSTPAEERLARDLREAGLL